jgi:hypothetical protein
MGERVRALAPAGCPLSSEVIVVHQIVVHQKSSEKIIGLLWSKLLKFPMISVG